MDRAQRRASPSIDDRSPGPPDCRRVDANNGRVAEVAGEAPDQRLRVVLVEDDDFTRVTLKAALASYGLDVVATVADAKSAMSAVVDLRAQVGVFDLDLGPGPTGLDVAHGVRRLVPDLGVVILTSYEDPRLFSTSLAQLPRNAAYVVKQSLEDLGFLVEAIRGSRRSSEQAQSAPRVDLTDAQIETLRLLACGLSNSEIARVRVVEVKSVEQTIARTARRLGITSGEQVNQRVALARAFSSLIGSRSAPEGL